MKEHNKKTLIEALSTLPEHEPNDGLWDQIETNMQMPETERFPRQFLRQLPQYDPPASVWDAIVRETAAEGKVRFIGWKRVLAVAASLALLLVAYWQLNRTTNLAADAVAVSYSQEEVDPLLVNQNWDEDEDAFQEFLSLCEGKKFVCERPEFKQLQGELEELTQAKNDLKDALGAYGANPELVIQMKEIELERTDLLKKMMVMLI